MDAYLAHQRLIAAARRAAQPIASRRHAHISATPFVMLVYRLSGDEGAPVGFMYGTDSARPKVVVVAEPRNRDLRFRALTAMARDTEAYFARFTTRVPVLDKSGRQKISRNGDPQVLHTDAPQIVVPNPGTAEWLAMLGRATVWLRTEGDGAVDTSVRQLGGHLTHLTGRRALPGSASIVCATELLTTHWATGQTEAEDANLAALLSWIDPQWLDASWFRTGTMTRGLDAVDAARLAETLPTAGPVPDPAWDKDHLEPAISDYHELLRTGADSDAAAAHVRDAIVAALTPTWAATWHSVDVVRSLPVAPGAEERWERERWAWTMHWRRVETDSAFFRKSRTAVQSARLLSQAEAATAAVKASMAFDDPLIMARAIADGTAIEGVVVQRDDSHRVPGPSGTRMVKRPLITIRPHEPCLQPIDTGVTLAGDTRVKGRIISLTDEGLIVIMISAGMRAGSLPSVGDDACLATFEPPTRYPDTFPGDVPWTHRLPEPQEGAA